MKQHSRDTTGRAFEIGKKAEDGFKIFAQNKGWQVKNASKEENCNEHWDFKITKGENSFKVDVKSEKRINRGDANTQSDLVWCEILNVKGDKGWLHGNADFICFERNSEFHVIEREKLVSIVETLVKPEKVYKASDALYKLYTRFRRKDLLTIIKFSDIEPHCVLI